MDFVARGAQIAVQELQDEETTPGGIVIPDTAKKVQRRGEVVSVGEGAVAADGTRIPPIVSRGDKVLFWIPEDYELVEIEDLKFYVIQEMNILGSLVE